MEPPTPFHTLDQTGSGGEVAAARLDELDGGQPPAAPIAQLDGLFPASSAVRAAAELTGAADPGGDTGGHARVAALGGDHHGSDTSPVALFDAAQISTARAGVRVAELGGARRAGRTGRPTRERGSAGQHGEQVAGRGERRGDSTGGGERGGEDGGAARRAGRRARGRSSAAVGAGASAPERPDVGGPVAEGRAAERRERRATTAPRGGREREPELDADPVAVARETCLRLLTDRARTRQELAQALRRNGVPDEAAHTVLERFDEVGLIDDAAFAGQWVRSRHTRRGLARRAIAVELRRKGVSTEDAEEALAEVDPESEEQRARELVERKLRSLTVATAEQRAAAARRLVGMLARKGYGAGVAYRVVREALAAAGAEADELGDAEPAED